MIFFQDLLFCPAFTIVAPATVGPDTLDDFSIESIQHIWEKGVGFAYSRKTPPHIDSNRTEILKLLLTCFSETMYYSPPGEFYSFPSDLISKSILIKNFIDSQLISRCSG